eukprot:TRINITY_DN8800_c0_g1_i1.p1 TRINITY_DN8800_c0_g1~~TRINITY_DN8800_c0_g1_i1.p1  ORF type:complete len:198 (-),score=51.49 TRINITY_DN8800_c0_g1_i1:42-635(-)
MSTSESAQGATVKLAPARSPTSTARPRKKKGRDNDPANTSTTQPQERRSRPNRLNAIGDHQDEDKPESEKGSGVFLFPNGSKYEGEWQKFEGIIKRHGKGVSTELEGTAVYDGEWKEDNMEGKGTFTYPSGAVYEGDWVNNKYQGNGKYTFPDGSYYEGEFVDNKMHGDGSFVDTERQVWKGKFYNNNGPGLVTWYT